jgi:hypothetical protein
VPPGTVVRTGCSIVMNSATQNRRERFWTAERQRRWPGARSAKWRAPGARRIRQTPSGRLPRRAGSPWMASPGFRAEQDAQRRKGRAKKRGGRSWPPPVFPLITCFRNASLHPLRLPCLRPMLSASICPYRASLPLQTIGAGTEDARRSSCSVAKKMPLIYIGLGLPQPGFKGWPQP